MADSTDPRVAVYVDFDNIVISRYRQLHPEHKNELHKVLSADDIEKKTRLKNAEVNIDALFDYASSFGAVALSRAYADWSLPNNAAYRSQLVGRAVDLIQMFPTVQSLKNGTDVRLATDAIEDIFMVPGLTHLVIVSGDSDFIALAQKAKKLGKYVVGIGVEGSKSASLAAACNEYVSYDLLPGVIQTKLDPEALSDSTPPATPSPKPSPATPNGTQAEVELAMPKRGASAVFVQALRLGHDKLDSEWLALAGVKSQMLRMDATFNEKELNYSTFSDFVKARGSIVEFDETGPQLRIRLRDGYREKSTTAAK